MIDFSAIADGASERYGIMLSSLEGVWSSVINFEDPLLPATKRSLIEQARAVANNYLDIESGIIGDEIPRVALRARTDALKEVSAPVASNDMPTSISAHLSAIGAHLTVEIHLQIERDIESLVLALKNRIMEIDFIVASQRISRDNAILKTRIKLTGPMFIFRDRAGRRHQSSKHLRVIWRQALLLSHIETKLMTYAEAEVTSAVVVHADQDHRFNGLAFNLVGEKSYLDIRDEVFHPNAEVDVRPS